MRLIDADKLKVYLQEYLGYGHAIPWVDAQPTAYDVDKVVEKIHNELFTYDIPTDICDDIVRKGGVECIK